MASVYGTNATVLISTGVTPSTALQAEKQGGKVRTITDKFTGAACPVGTLIYLGQMPKGAIPLGGSIRYSGSSTATLQIGYTGATSALGTATALATTKTQRLYPSANQWGVPLTANVDIYATVGTKALVTSNILYFEYEYAKE